MTVYGVGSDADPRLLCAMRKISNLGQPLDEQNTEFILWKDFFFANPSPEMIVFQDHYHVLTKFRNRLLDTSRPLRLGHQMITIASLKVKYSI